MRQALEGGAAPPLGELRGEDRPGARPGTRGAEGFAQDRAERQLRGRHAELDAGLRGRVREAQRLRDPAVAARPRGARRRFRRRDGALLPRLPPHGDGAFRGELRGGDAPPRPRLGAAPRDRALRRDPVRRPPLRRACGHPDGRVLGEARQPALGAPGRVHRPREGAAHRRGGVLHHERARGALAEHPVEHEGEVRLGLRGRAQPHHLPPLRAPAVDGAGAAAGHDDGAVRRPLRPHADVVGACEGVAPLPAALPVDAAGGDVRVRRGVVLSGGLPLHQLGAQPAPDARARRAGLHL